MTENEVRDLFVRNAEGFIGAVEGSREHMDIVDAYNSQEHLPRGYALKYSDPWCAGFVSAIGILAGLSDIILPEVGTDAMLYQYQIRNQWEEDDGYTPATGDIIFFDWDDSGNGDNMSATSHVGIVAACQDGWIKTIEGNKGNKVDTRYIPVNSRYIRGFALPDFGKYASEGSEDMRYDTLEDCPAWSKDTIGKLIDNGTLAGTDGTLDLSLDMIRLLVILDRNHIFG